MISADILKALPQNLRGFLDRSSMVKDIFDAIPFQIVVKSLREEDFGEFLVWNKVAEDALGILANEAIGRSDWDFFPEEQAEFFAARDREVAQSGKPLLTPTEQIVSRSRGLRTLRTVKTPIYAEDGEPVAILAVSEDITDERTTERELQKALDFLSHVNSQLPGVVYQFQLTSVKEITFPYVSEGLRGMTGYEAEAVMEGHEQLLEHILPEDRPGVLTNVLRSYRRMQDCNLLFRLRISSGDVRWILANSAPKRQEDGSTLWYGFATDVTSHRETTEALKRGDERLHSALEATRAAAWDLDTDSGALHVSQEWGALFGFDATEFPMNLEQWLVLMEESDESTVRELISGSGQKQGGQVEVRHVRHHGQGLWVLISSKPVFDEAGKIIRQVGTVMDITDRKLIETQLIEAKESAERANRAKSNFLAMMSHEVRTPLNAVLGFADLLSSTPLSDEQSDYLRAVQDSSAALLVILNEVLDYSKIEADHIDLHPKPVNVPDIVASSVDYFRSQAAAKHLRLDYVCSRDLPELLICDGTRLSQLLHKLLSNAVKFTEQGNIVVELLAAEQSMKGEQSLILRVRDTGVGISSDKLKRLFDPFYQADSSTSRRFGGTGLGLAIVKRLVDLMNGQIHVESHLGEGTIFTLEFGLAHPAAEVASVQKNETMLENEVSDPSIKILIVEDNATNRRLVKLFLNKLGYEADEAANGFEGLNRASETNYQLIFMDIEMPEMDGYEASRRILKLPGREAPRIVALTAHALPEHRARCFEAGMEAYLCKPVKKSELAAILRQSRK